MCRTLSPIRGVALRFPERLLHFVESVEARQPHVRQVAFTKPLEVITRLSATLGLRIPGSRVTARAPAATWRSAARPPKRRFAR